MKKKIVLPLILVLAAALVCVFAFTNSPGQDLAGTVCLKVSCEKVVALAESDAADISDSLPTDGIVAEVKDYPFYTGETVFDVLLKVLKENKIAINYTGGAKDAYVKSISGISDGQFGTMSGWIYTINGEFASVGCSQYLLSDGDKIEFNYSVNMADDFGF